MKQKSINKKVKNYKKKIIGAFISLMIISTLIFSFLYTRYIKSVTYDNVYRNISELGEQTATQLNLSISNHVQFVNTVVDFINGRYANTLEEIFTRFNADLEKYHFTRLVILDENGNGITSDGKEVIEYANIEEFFKQDDVYLSENRPSTVSKEQVNIYSKKFQWNGNNMVLFATINTEDYKEILSRRLFNGEGGTYLVNNKGVVLINSFEKILSENTNIYDCIEEEFKLTSEKSKDKINKMIQNIQKQKNGTFDITSDKKIIFFHYEKLQINDWYVITLAPASIIAKELSVFLGFSLGLCFIINLIVIGFFICMYLFIQKKNRKIYETAYIDSVTGLGNEVYFKEKVSKFLGHKNKNSYIMILDINKFKVYNKQYNYEFCNKILKQFGTIIKKLLPAGNVTCRLSKDIFATCFSYNDDITKLIEQIFEGTTKLKIENIELSLNISVGIYLITNGDNDVNKILDKAYMAHSKIKGLYGNNYFIFDQSLEEKFLDEQKIESEMEIALENHEFKVFYQPKVYTSSGQLAGAEALVRWCKNDTIIPPNKFIPIFEKNKFIIKLDLYVFEKVCQDLVSWKEKYENVPIISVNVSKEHFVDETFIDEYVEITDKYDINREKIDLEITESTTIENIIDLNKILSKIKEKGFIISIDDFGTGYSSLSMLQDMPLDVLKIDKTFIDNANLKSDENMINYIVFMAKKLGVKIIAEGIETKDQVDFIKNLECDMFQGYYCSKPILKEDFENYLEKDFKERVN